MKKLGEYVKWYLYITTSILIVFTIFMIGVYKEESISTDNLWQILLSGFLTTVVTVLIAWWEKETKVKIVFSLICHYAALCVVMIMCGHWFGWVEYKPQGIIMMMLAVAGVYLLAAAASYIIDVRQANAINHKLKEKYGDEE